MEAKKSPRLTNYDVCCPWKQYSLQNVAVVVSYSTCSSPPLDQVQESARTQKIAESNTIGERLMVKEESAASVGARPWTPEGRSLPLSIALILQLGMQKEDYEEWMSIDEDIPVAATLTDLDICQAIKVDDSDRDECVE
ncbi:hypothetical protein AVEN_162072-1 [Araneus ventricosus]|uniref:Uncharacterized protein n=1 Tax=Araneus ventricosus TaxID=182803 RepID=A0A4Y2L5N1_ARAVE|nr:hypothetical protein AVEN_162072-1 [Araneus ventricosus]